jgi:hypothetical protein
MNLAFPTGLARAGEGRLFVSEASRHRILALEKDGKSLPQPALSDLPAYPGIAPARDGGFWLALFAPRNQLVEFVLREDDYRRRMIDTVDPNFWIAPSLSSGVSCLEPIQGGTQKAQQAEAVVAELVLWARRALQSDNAAPPELSQSS